MNEHKDWCGVPEVVMTGNGWCVRINGCDVFDPINQHGCKGLRSFDIVKGLDSKEAAEAFRIQWLREQLPEADAQSELAALREELAAYRGAPAGWAFVCLRKDGALDIVVDSTERLAEARAQHWREQGYVCAVKPVTLPNNHLSVELPKALAAAEQRNAETSASLQLATKLLDQTLAALNPTANLAKNIRALLKDHRTKPTESGASDKCTCIRQPQEPQCTDCPNRKSGASE